MRRFLPLPLAVVTVALIVSSVGAAEAATVKCNKLVGKNFAKNGKVKIVRKKLSRGQSRFFGCVLPGGAVRPIGPVVGPDQTGYDTSESIVSVRGTFAAVEIFGGVGQTAMTFGDSRVYNLTTGKSYVYDEQSSSEEGQQSGKYGLGRKSFLNAHGRLVGSYQAYSSDDDAKITSIVSYSPSGEATLLDKGDAAVVLAQSLKLVGTTASWTSGGVTKTATLP
ncbi:MAG: hypothetical protein JWO02_3090 [Solirubrobacterales bacterium]|nr:hypothetical protein [Solirubrobacterales bacterium]